MAFVALFKSCSDKLDGLLVISIFTPSSNSRRARFFRIIKFSRWRFNSCCSICSSNCSTRKTSWNFSCSKTQKQRTKRKKKRKKRDFACKHKKKLINSKKKGKKKKFVYGEELNVKRFPCWVETAPKTTRRTENNLHNFSSLLFFLLFAWNKFGGVKQKFKSFFFFCHATLNG